MKNIKTVNNGNVFGTGKWFTYYCEKCGNQVTKGMNKCKPVHSFVAGCGADLDWN